MNTSIVNERWWDFTCLEKEVLDAAERLTINDLEKLSNDNLTVTIHDNIDDMFLSQALQYIKAWQSATEDKPAGICGPVGPTRQLPIVAKLVNELNMDLRHCHFWAMDEWVKDNATVDVSDPLSFRSANLRLMYEQIRSDLRMPEENLHFLTTSNLNEYSESYDKFDCRVMQGGLGHALHWAFNDPYPRGENEDTPMSAEEYKALGARRVQLHPISQIQNAGGLTQRNLNAVPSEAVTVGPKETFKCDEVSIWYPGNNQNPFGLKLAIYMIANQLESSLVPVSVLSQHPNISFHVYRGAIQNVDYLIG